VGFELVLGNAGSTEGSRSVLEEYAANDPRIRLIHQENQGLTQALIRGCTEARGEFIARQDVDNASAPTRLRDELAAARGRAGISLVSCGTSFVGPKGEFLYEIVQEAEGATESLLTFDIDRLRGPSHHGSVLFPTELYRRVGGYRSEFRVAQDVDLWVRLAECGEHVPVQRVLQRARITLDGISSGMWKRQKRAGELILESAVLRRSGRDDAQVLARVRSTLSAWPQKPARAAAGAAYFIGSCLMKRNEVRAARPYLLQAVRHRPLHLKAWILFLQTRLTR